MRADIRGVQREGMGQEHREWTYNDDTGNSNEVPEEIFFSEEPRVSHFQLAQVLVGEIRIQDESDLGTADEEGGHKPPYFRREGEDPVAEEQEPVESDQTKVRAE